MKEKIIVLGDTHGRDKWKDIIKKNSNANKVIFIGDYFDSFDVPGDVQIANFKEIIDYKRNNIDKVVLLFGNHEFHYIQPGQRYSGYQHRHEGEINGLIHDALADGSLTMAHKEGKFLFTHAGVTKTWCLNNGLGPNDRKIVESINELFRIHRDSFDFYRGDITGYGEHPRQSPIWVRPHQLQEDGIEGWKHVVGHTHQDKITYKKNAIFIDTFDRSNEYLTIVDGKPHRIKT